MKWWFLAVAASLLAQVSAAQQLSTPFSIDDPMPGPASGAQRSPTVTWTGSAFLVVWADDRDGRSSDLWFRTFDRQGQPLNSFSAPLLRAAGRQDSPSASTGSEVLVAWLDDTICASEVMAQRFTVTGQPDGALLRLSTGACTAERPSIAWDSVSSQWLVVWGSHGAGREVHGAIVAADGTIAVSNFVIAAGPNSATNPSVVSPSLGPERFVVTWSDDHLDAGQANLFAASVSASGLVGTASQVHPSAAVQRASCSAPLGTNSDVLISWVEGTDVLAQVVSSAGVPQGSSAVVTSGPLTEVYCASGPAGSVLVASTDTRAAGPGVFLRAFDADGGVSPEFAAAPRVSYFGRDLPRLAVTGDDALLVARGPWGYVTGDDIVGRALSLGAGLSADAGVFLVANSSSHSSRVRAASDGTRYLAVWRDDGESSAGSDSLGQLIEAGTGRGLIDGGLRFSTNSANLVSYPTVAGSSAGFFVSRGDEGSAGQLMGARVSSQGVISSSGLLSDLSSYVNTHQASWLVDGWATTFLKSGTLRVQRTSPSGAVVLPETTLVSTGGAPEQLDSASLDDVMLSVFLARDAGLDVWGARFRADAGLLDPSGFAITNLAGDEIDPAVGAGRSLFLVAWSKGGDVFATRVTRQGLLLDSPPLRLGGATGIEILPAVGWTGLNFLVAFQREGDVVAVRVSESGAVLDAMPIVIADTAELDRSPGVATGPAGEALVTWESFSESLGDFHGLGRFVIDPLIDAGVDAGETDAGVSDAGQSESDAGQSDAGRSESDAGQPDAGPSESDAGQSDAGPDAARLELKVGCGCTSGTELFFVLALLLARRAKSSH